MTQSELECAVARITGESRRMVHKHGFHLLDDPELPPDDLSLVLDCPGCGALVPMPSPVDATLSVLAECRHCDAAYPFQEHELYAVTTAEGPLVPCA